jgi:hypothetical protein
MTLYAARQVKLIAKGTFQRQGYRPKGKRKRQLYILQGVGCREAAGGISANFNLSIKIDVDN